ncbi:MAG: DNA methyltransferase, partial [Chloroflexota bacterium]
MLEAEYTELPAKTARPGEIECLGLAFENEQQRRDYFLDRLGEKLADPEFRQIEGFPLGSTEAILALSDPPYYTACPNPFIAAFVRHYCQSYNPEEPGVMEPYGGDFSSSNRHPVYSFHPYHTKVPPEVIRALIEHYTKPGDLILDGFCGTGMTGVAAREAGRNALIVDLSPVASFISGVNCQSQDGRQALWVFEEIIAAAEQKWGYLYQTEEALQKLSVNYYVWSDIFTCPACDYEFPFFPHGVIHHSNKVETLKSFPCPSCLAPLTVRRIARVVVQEKKQKALVWVNVGKGRERINRLPNEYDLKLAAHLEKIEPLAWYPRDAVNPAGYSAQLAQLGDKAITTVSRFLSHRNLIVFSDLWERVSRIEDVTLRNLCRATLTSIFTVISERQGYFGGGGGMSGNLY